MKNVFPLSSLMVVALWWVALVAPGAAHASRPSSLSVVRTRGDASSSGAVPGQRTLMEEEYVPYAIGTPIYYEWQGDWYAGEINHYIDGVYTISYPDDDEIDTVDDLHQIDVMVRAATVNANPDLYDIGTPVMDGDLEGEIVDYLNSQYRVEWSDRTVKAYTPNAAFDALVAAAVGPTATPTETATTKAPTAEATVPPTDDDNVDDDNVDDDNVDDDNVDDDATETGVGGKGKYPIGTLVYKDFPDDGKDEWFWGRVVMYEDGMYEIKWSDNANELYDEDAEMDQMVQDALTNNRGDSKEQSPWENGTAVFKVFSDGDYYGEIIGYADGYYSVRWSDGDLEEYSIQKTNAMVKDAYDRVEAQRQAEMKAQKQKSRRTRFGMVVLSLGGLLAVAAVLRRRRTRKEASIKSIDDMVTFSDVSLDSSSFKDQEHGQPVLDALPALPAVV